MIRRYAPAATLLLLLVAGGCDQLDRASATADACTAALEARDSLAKNEDEAPDLAEFQEEAQRAENPALAELANRAVLAADRGDLVELEVVLDETRSVCESEGAV